MKLWFRVSAVAVIAAFAYSLVGCSAPSGFSYQNVAVTLSVQCSDCPTPIYNPAYPAPSAAGQPAPAGSVLTMPATGQGGTYLFTANVANAPATNVTWALYPSPNLTTPNPPPTSTTGTPTESTSQVGTLNAASGNTAYYSQNGVPVYSGAALQQANAMGIPQGMVLVVASVPSDPANPSAVTTGSQLIQIFGGSTTQGPPSVYLTPATPTTPSGITTAAVTVAHGGGTYSFYGGVVGAAPCTTTANCLIQSVQEPLDYVDNTPIWYVGPTPANIATAVPGGNACFGTISNTGVYTAPAAIPTTAASSTCTTATGFTGTAGEVVVYVGSHLLASQNASGYLISSVSKYAYVGVN